MSQPPLLEIRDLVIEASAGKRTAPGSGKALIDGINLTLKRGEVLGLIGESGAGKSTLGLGAMGFTRDGCRFAGGSVTFDGTELTSARPAVRRGLRSTRIAYVAQSAAASFNPAYKLIRQYAEFPVLAQGRSRREVEADAVTTYRQMKLPNPEEIGFRYPHQVSGGQLQRAMTAMAMACRPDLIIFDEPTTALDVTTQIEVLGAIRDAVRDFGTAALYITHDLAVVSQMADRIMVLRHGKLVEEAATETMLADPQEEYTRSLWAVRAFEAPAKPVPAEDVQPLVSLRKVTASYGRIGPDVLRAVSFDLHAGRTLAVVGESGSGKTTAARCAMGLLPRSGGDVLLDGVSLPPDYRKRSKAQLQQVQIIYQMADTALNPKQKIGDIIARPLKFYTGLRGRKLTARVRELMTAIDLDPDVYYHRRPGELSGGQKQRIGIARALAAEPRVVICDEVTSALDQLVAEGILRLLARLQQELGISYLFITHDIATVRAIADDVVVMQHGQVVEAGPKAQVLDNPQQDYTKSLLASVPEMDAGWLDRVLTERVAAR
ncbi:ABC transporter ATP-binding protein [Pararhodobacter oceanensis]|uniref:ABC transporter n=1 Tax=Pararhodobacter oceanensis TaxID=2172121 RepID=A0A2T8HRI4_9RHOB|nr:ABC transporter ATP-binding protein [Pararhodobacter oceanensis]PVH28037.1 ABC transporter [Pararhodobacter oceanensis]